MRIEYAMKSAPQSEAELLAIYKGSHGRLRGVLKPIVKMVELEPILVEPKLAEPVQVPVVEIVKTERPRLKWSFVVDPFKGGPSETPTPSIWFIKSVVAKKYKVTVLDLESERRTMDICRPRHVAAYLCTQMTHRGLPAIGREFGKRDHTTILSSRNRIARLIAVDEDFEKEIHDLKQVILDTYREVAP